MQLMQCLLYAFENIITKYYGFTKFCPKTMFTDLRLITNDPY